MCTRVIARGTLPAVCVCVCGWIGNKTAARGAWSKKLEQKQGKHGTKHQTNIYDQFRYNIHTYLPDQSLDWRGFSLSLSVGDQWSTLHLSLSLSPSSQKPAPREALSQSISLRCCVVLLLVVVRSCFTSETTMATVRTDPVVCLSRSLSLSL